MGVKILLADDSPTILKVVKIILAKEPFEVVECARDSELLDKLSKHRPQMVFLDFNFSETRTGYDLCRDIKAHHPDCKILMMYATFDTVEEGALRDSGADQHVVKPFDSNRFIFQVRGLAETSTAPATAWEAPEATSSPAAPSLEDELSGWGMTVPGVIGKLGGEPELPPVIEHTPDFSVKPVAAVTHADTVNLPDDDDLAYPDMFADTPVKQAQPKSKLVSLNELSLDVAEDKPTSLELMANSGMDEDARRIEEQIRDEVEADLWKVDAFEEVNPRLAVVKNKTIEDKDDNLEFTSAPAAQSYDENMFGRLDSNDRPGSGSVDLESLRPMIKQMINEAVREYCRQQVDKVAWEVIPDLAENLIKKELQQISHKVTRDS